MRKFILATVFLTWMISSAYCVNAQESEISLYTGAFYTSGTYDDETTIKDLYFPFSIKFSGNKFGYRLTVPYVVLDATAKIYDDADPAQTLPTTINIQEEGMGDVVTSVTAYNVINNRAHNFAIDVTGRIKFATADSELGLGTGENDYELLVEFYRFFDRSSLYYAVGYKVRGDPEETDLNNVWSGRAGLTHQLSSVVKGGLLYGYRQSSIENTDAIQDLSGFISLDVSKKWQIQLHGLTGLSDTSPDWEAGIIIKTVFK